MAGAVAVCAAVAVAAAAGASPDNEVGVSLLHDELLRADVLLLPRVHYVPLLQDLHGKRL